MKYIYLLVCLVSCLIFTKSEEKINELKIEVLNSVENCERKTKDGDYLSIHYDGRLASNGEQFDTSYSRNQPFSFKLGSRYVIPGWDQGTQGMCVGEKRRLFIPSELAYGEKGAGERIPPNSDLIFDVELINIEDTAPPQPNVFKDIDSDNDGQLSREEVGDYLKKQIPEEMKDEEEVANFDQDKMVEEIFLHEDRDKNGFISHDEFTGPKHDEL